MLFFSFIILRAKRGVSSHSVDTNLLLTATLFYRLEEYKVKLNSAKFENYPGRKKPEQIPSRYFVSDALTALSIKPPFLIIPLNTRLAVFRRGATRCHRLQDLAGILFYWHLEFRVPEELPLIFFPPMIQRIKLIIVFKFWYSNFEGRELARVSSRYHYRFQYMAGTLFCRLRKNERQRLIY